MTTNDESACRRKATYASKRIAKIMVKKQKANGVILLEVYRCPVCDLWHLTKKHSASYKATQRKKKVITNE